MSRHVLLLAVLGGLLFSSSAWAIPQGSSCRLGGRSQSHTVLGGPMCWLNQDPWQDCNEDPWQLSIDAAAPDRFSDPWQDDVDPWQDAADPWQPFVAEVGVSSRQETAQEEAGNDPWQPVVSQVVRASGTVPSRDSFEDPWQPAFADPWQEGAEDPWQLP